MQRRSFLGLILAGTVAPSIVKSSSLMKLAALKTYASDSIVDLRGRRISKVGFWTFPALEDAKTDEKLKALNIKKTIFTDDTSGLNSDDFNRYCAELDFDYDKFEEQMSRAMGVSRGLLSGRVGARGSIDPKTGLVTFDSFNLVR